MKHILGIVLIILGGISYYFFSHYEGHLIPVPFLFTILSAGIVVLGFYIFIHFLKAPEPYNFIEIRRLKKEGEKIDIVLLDCDFLINNYTVEKEISSNYKVQGLDTIYNGRRSVKNIDYDQIVLVHEYIVNGKSEKFYSQTIFKEEITLRFLLEKQSRTFIYVDKKNRDNYYFDLEFLEVQ